MIAYLIQSSTGYVEDVFLGNGDELTPAQMKELSSRLRKLLRKLRLSLIKRAVDSVKDLEQYVTDLETDEASLDDKTNATHQLNRVERL